MSNTYEQNVKIVANRIQNQSINKILLADYDEPKWKIIVEIQNYLNEDKCSQFMSRLSTIIHNGSHTEATIENRIQALAEIL